MKYAQSPNRVNGKRQNEQVGEKILACQSQRQKGDNSDSELLCRLMKRRLKPKKNRNKSCAEAPRRYDYESPHHKYQKSAVPFRRKHRRPAIHSQPGGKTQIEKKRHA